MRLFLAPLMEKYHAQHKAEFEPTSEELKAAARFFARKKPAGKKAGGGKTAGDNDLDSLKLAEMIVGSWNFQRPLYDKFGGGRVLWQQAGMEAYDAMRKWLEAQETGGNFRLTDPDLRGALFKYWVDTSNHGHFLISDPERIRKEFLEPEWHKK